MSHETIMKLLFGGAILFCLIAIGLIFTKIWYLPIISLLIAFGLFWIFHQMARGT